MSSARSYRFAPLGTRLTLFGFTVAAPLVVVLAGDAVFGGWAWDVLGALFAVAVAIGCVRTGVTLDENAIVVCNMLRTRRFAWVDVTRIEPSRDPAGSDLLVLLSRRGRRRILISFGAGRRGDQLVDALKAVLGPRASGIIGFRPPTRARCWSREQTSWRAAR